MVVTLGCLRAKAKASVSFCFLHQGRTRYLGFARSLAQGFRLRLSIRRELFCSGLSAYSLFSTDPLQMFLSYLCRPVPQRGQAKSLAIIPESPNTELIEAHCFHGQWGSCWVLRIRGFSALGLRFHSALGLKVSCVQWSGLCSPWARVRLDFLQGYEKKSSTLCHRCLGLGSLS